LRSPATRPKDFDARIRTCLVSDWHAPGGFQFHDDDDDDDDNDDDVDCDDKLTCARKLVVERNASLVYRTTKKVEEKKTEKALS